MSEYYAVQRSEEYLAHYGVKGMKWGVRKAMATGNMERLGRHYKRAAKKLQKLSIRADKNLIERAKQINKKRMLPSAALSGLASGLGTYAINGHVPAAKRAQFATAVGLGMSAADLIGSGIDHAVLSRWTSKKGNAKKVADRNNFEREMRKAFKGTKYAREINRTKSNIDRRVRDIKRIYDSELNNSYYSSSSKPNRRKNNRRG